MQLEPLIDFYQNLTPASVADFGSFYSDDAYFKDPFNEVRGLTAIQRIFTHMFSQVTEPRFVITAKVGAGDTAMLVWELGFRTRRLGHKEAMILRGMSHLRFDAAGKVCFHRDYWDTAEELYMKLPLLGGVLRGLRKALSA
ncbi:MAG: nuclear transport factor 2 family protein [Rhodocyclaceae bacterium]|nr:nuclear transport factor 2 family protein [Rhodocyclaceae bacterium]